MFIGLYVIDKNTHVPIHLRWRLTPAHRRRHQGGCQKHLLWAVAETNANFMEEADKVTSLDKAKLDSPKRILKSGTRLKMDTDIE
jgi:hypothetical protein